MMASSRSGGELVLVVGFAIALGLPLLDPRTVPMHDTFYSFANFYVFYSHFFANWDLVHWLPYGAYGLPAALQQVISFSPLDYVAALLGALLRVRDVMLLFKLATLGEQVLFAAGTWLLGRALFADRATALALGIAAAGTVVWYAQLWFELRFFYLLPLVLFCVVRFDTTRAPEWLWIAALVCVAWAMGNVPYFIPLWIFTLVLIVTPVAFGWGRDWLRLLAPTPRNLLLAGVFVLASSSFVFLSLHALDFLVIREPGRDPFTRKVDLETFRTWGGNARLGVVARSFLLATPVHLPWGMGRDNSAYVGLLPIAGLVLALVRERSRLFAGLVLAASALVWLSLGGLFTTWVYYVPLLSEFRHVGLVYGMVKALVIIAAGYGIDRLWRPPELARRTAWMLAGGLALASLAVLPAAWSHGWLVRLWLYAALGAGSLALAGSLRAGLLLALALDVSIYQADVRALAPTLRTESAASLAAFDVSPLPYQARRSSRPEGEAGANPTRTLQALELAMQERVTSLYWTTWGFAQFDPCGSRLWMDTLTFGVDTLMRLGEEEDVDIRDRLACEVPKLRLVSGPAIARTLPQALELLAQPAGEGPRDVIRVPPRQSVPRAASVRTPDPGTVAVTSFDANELVATTRVTPPGAWLVYADAFHPGWTAFLDGRETFVAESNLAFKAVWVPEGEHTVRFRFGRGLALYASYAVASFGVLAGFGLPAGVGFLAWGKLRS